MISFELQDPVVGGTLLSHLYDEATQRWGDLPRVLQGVSRRAEA